MATSGLWAPGHIACFYRECLALNWCDGTLRCNSEMYRLTVYILQKTEKSQPFEFLGDRSTVINLIHVERCCFSYQNCSWVLSFPFPPQFRKVPQYQLTNTATHSYKPTPFTVKVPKNYRWALTREQRGRGSLNFLPRFLEFNSIRLM